MTRDHSEGQSSSSATSAVPAAVRDAVQQSIADAPREFDLSSGEGFCQATRAAARLAQLNALPADLEVLERELAEQSPAAPLSTQLALKLARSKAYVRAIDEPSFLSVVFAVYKEHERVLRPTEHAHGEDFLRRKVAQLKWLCDGTALDWELIAVDDGCPAGTGRLLEQIAREEGYGERVRVLHLADAIAKGVAVTRPLTTPDDSRKGGSIAYGMWDAVQTQRPNHVVVFTDADLSTHLGETGLLVHEIRAGALAAIGSRREETSVVIKGASRNDRGKLFIYLWKRLLAPLHRLTDTQCGFKAFDARHVAELTADLLEKKFAFDIELLLRVELMRSGSIAKVPVAWIDSEALSTTTDIQPYLPMLKQAAAMYCHYLEADPQAETFAAFIEQLDEARWQALLDHIPEAITSRDPATFGAFDAISAADLAAASGARS